MIVKPPNLVILDIDGVFNHHTYFENRQQHLLHDRSKLNSSVLAEHLAEVCPPEDLDRWAHKVNMISRPQLEFFDEFCEAANVKVVISSTWRSDGLEAMRFFLNTILGCKFEIVGITPHLNSRVRGEEIKKFLSDYIGTFYDHNDAWRFRRYMIVDDDSDMLFNQTANFMHVDSWNGITRNHTYKMTNFFKGFEL